jgi:methylmalonyl-CoA mutase N-terminal domain/subunit
MSGTDGKKPEMNELTTSPPLGKAVATRLQLVLLEEERPVHLIESTRGSFSIDVSSA